MTAQLISAMPAQLLFEKWSEIGFDWQGHLLVSDLPRLYKEVDATLQADSPMLNVACTLKKIQKIVWLDFDIKGLLQLTCHRCLSPITHDVSGTYRMAILTSDSQVGTLMADDDKTDYLFLSEINDGRYLPIVELLEDELLLTLPLSTTHQDCDMLVASAGDVLDTPKDNPFALLKQLKHQH